MVRGRQGTSADTVPTSMPSSVPSPNVDHSFTLQAVMEMQKSIGALDASVKSLTEATSALRASVTDVKDKVSKIEKTIYAAGVVLVIGLAAGGWMLNAAKDFALTAYKASVEAQKPPQETNRSVPQKP